MTFASLAVGSAVQVGAGAEGECTSCHPITRRAPPTQSPRVDGITMLAAAERTGQWCIARHRSVRSQQKQTLGRREDTVVHR